MATWLRKTAEFEAKLFAIQKTWWQSFSCVPKKARWKSNTTTMANNNKIMFGICHHKQNSNKKLLLTFNASKKHRG